MWPWKPKPPNFELQVLMVCTGNICRSPTAEGVLRKLLADRGLHAVIGVDSAGTHALSGSPPDARSVAAASQRGYELGTQRARQFVPQDFERFDRIVVMDGDNLRWLKAQAKAPGSVPLTQAMAKVESLMAYHHQKDASADVPDPHYGAPEGFGHVLTLIEAACQGLLLSLLDQHQARGNPQQ